ncbi:MAG: type II toxin-antitoxin system RelE/ParE family toxin [Halobacteria archaeon]
MAFTPLFTTRFLRDIKPLNRRSREELDRAVARILENPESGKPLSYHFKGCRAERFGKFRVVYRVSVDEVIFLAFGHRKSVYRR